MGGPYAEVIGDPVEQSKSPLIHKFWLEKLGIEGDYLATRVTATDLPAFLAERRIDPAWRGCNVTMPLKEAVLPLVDAVEEQADRSGAVNSIVRRGHLLTGANTDLAGLAAALNETKALGNQVCVIGAGGAARATLEFLRRRGTMEVSLVARDTAKGKAIHGISGSSGAVYPPERAEEAISGAEWLINATPLGMAGADPMPDTILEALREADEDALVFDMVYSPLETQLLRRARSLGLSTMDGLVMLIGQATIAFERFFGASAPREHDAELRALLTS